MKLRIYYIGKDKKNYFSEIEALYLKRIKHYIPVEVISLKPQKISSSLSRHEVQELEGQIFQKHLAGEMNVVLLDEGGKEMGSQDFSKFIEKKMNAGGHNLSVVIGGAYGFSSSMKAKYGNLLSLSKMTFAHHLARTVLLEQIYRAFTILNNEPYHNN